MEAFWGKHWRQGNGGVLKHTLRSSEAASGASAIQIDSLEMQR